MLEGLTARAMGALPLHAVRADGLTAFLGDLPAPVASFLRASGFTARVGEFALLPGADGLAGAVVGLGQDESPWAFGALARALPSGTAWRLAPGPQDPAQATLGWALGAYRTHRHKAAGPPPAVLEVPADAAAAVASAEAICAARDLINAPAADLGPAELAAATAALAARHGGTCEIVTGDSLDQGFPTVAAVGQGSPRAPRVAVLRWSGSDHGPLVALCGKGVCFDTGGLDLKPPSAMLRMKKDMGGAAVVLAAAEMVMRANLPVRLLVLIGAVENAVSGTAMRPMDVLRTRKGLKVEVGNTDAEGRLVLCDLLTFAAEQSPAMILDCATLTGPRVSHSGPTCRRCSATTMPWPSACSPAGGRWATRCGACPCTTTTIPGSTAPSRTCRTCRRSPWPGRSRRRCSCDVSCRPGCPGVTWTYTPGTILPGQDGRKVAKPNAPGPCMRWLQKRQRCTQRISHPERSTSHLPHAGNPPMAAAPTRPRTNKDVDHDHEHQPGPADRHPP